VNIAFFVKGDPKPQPRPRAFSRGGHARVYDPATAEGWKSLIAQEAKVVLPDKPIEGTIKLVMLFWMKRPKSHFNSKGQVKPTAPFQHIQKPDVDNLAKAVMDALSTLGMWVDDSQVFSLHAIKSWAGAESSHGVDISITAL
jgi:Holliday junction resolvase RusA-like endonuclease